MRAQVRLAVAIVSLAFVVAAHGAALGRPAVAQPELIEVALSEYLFTPSVVAVPPGTARLNLTNVGARRHNMVVFVNGIELESATLPPGDSLVWELALDRTATYQFWCNMYRHLEKGMVGEIAVQ